nr:AAA family ATPase [uncultured Allomuricauda sp.]
MTLHTKFSDVEIHVQDIDGKPMLVERILSDRIPKRIVFNAPGLLGPVDQNGHTSFMYSYESMELHKFDPKIPKTKEAIIDLLSICSSLVEAIKSLHQKNLSIGLLTSERLFQDQNDNLIILGNSLITNDPADHGFEHYTLGDFYYLAPECYENIHITPNHCSDFYALGIIIYTWFTGSLPFKGGDKMELMHNHLTRPPIAPMDINPIIPKGLNDMILTLLSKQPSGRYASVFGLIQDLETLIKTYTKGKTDSIKLHLDYNPGNIDFGQDLFGRDKLLQQLHDSYTRIEHFHSQVVFVEGFSGVGKTSMVQKFIEAVSTDKLLLLEGKFDQYKQTPYAAIQMAFKNLERQLLLKSKIDQKKLKRTLSTALGKNAGVLKEIIPDISVLVDKLEPVDTLNPIETRNRFNFVFQKFFEAVASLGLKIIFFIDDWQWCDQPSLQLIKSLSHQKNNGILYLFAYRGNETKGNHPFKLFKDETEKLEYYRHLLVKELNSKMVGKMISTSLGMDEPETNELSNLIFQKTEGNPYHTKQFVISLNQKGLLTYDFESHVWKWDKSAIEKEDSAENVVDLIIQKIDKLSFEVRVILKIASCIGGRFDFDLISAISGIEKETLALLLDVSIGNGHITKYGNQDIISYHFSHDRVQQAAYQLEVPTFKLSNSELHYRIGTYLFEKGANDLYSERDILLHFINSKELISKDISSEIIDSVVGLGNNSGLSVTPEASKQYFELGLYLSDKYKMNQYRYKCFFGLAESLFLLNKVELAEDIADKAYDSTDYTLEKVELLRMKMLFYESYAMYEKNIETGLEAMALFGINAKEHFAENSLANLIEKEYTQFNKLTANRFSFEELSHRKMTDPKELGVMDILVNMNASAYFVDLHLFAWSTLRMTNQTLIHGFTNSTPFALVFMGSLLVALYQNFGEGYTLGKTGVDLLSKVDNDQYKCRTLSIFPIFIQHFKEPILNGTKILDESIYSGLETGDLPYAGYSFYAKIRDAFLAGNDLKETLELCNDSIAFMESVNNLGLLALMKLLKGSLLKLLGDYDAAYEAVEKEALQFLIDVKFFTAVSHHYIFRSWTNCILKDFESANELLQRNEEIIIFAASQPHVPKHYFLHSLCLLYLNPKLTPEMEERIGNNQNMLMAWHDSMPENFGAEYYIIETLLKGRKDNISEALTSFNSALICAEKGKLLGVKAFAYEIASDMLKSSDYAVLAEGFEKNANIAYEQWNALSKVNIRSKSKFNLLDKGKKGNDLNTSSLIKSMQAISSEVNKADVIGKLLNTIMENAGADRSVLLLLEKGAAYIEADISSVQENNTLTRQRYAKQKSLPTNIIDYVMGSKKEFILEQQNTSIGVDHQYVHLNKVLSLLALPLVRQQELIGVLYLENHQFSGLFEGNDLEILKIIASQAAISIYNTLLFQEAADLNIALLASKDELSKMNLLLEEKIKDRTKVLRQEIEIRKQVEVELKKAQNEAEKFHQQQLKAERRDALQSKMMMLSSQMNPHFIFNSLGSVQSYILNNETNRAVDFISEFAGLMRKNLINSTTKYISIAEELEFLDKYLLLEQLRFNNSFDYKIDQNLDNIHDTLIPPMLLQPFIENAIIHGLSKLEERKGKLKIVLEETEETIICTIQDNGIGRENAEKKKSKAHKSVAVSNLETRLELLNTSSGSNEYTYEISDLKKNGAPTGTKVVVSFPNDLH